jgi:hypothetical protein
VKKQEKLVTDYYKPIAVDSLLDRFHVRMVAKANRPYHATPKGSVVALKLTYTG